MPIKIFLILIFSVSFFIGSCKQKVDKRVPLKQITIDKSTDYRYLFKKAIQEERKRDNRYKKNEFKD